MPEIRGPARRLATPYGQGIVSNLTSPKMLGPGFVFCTLTFPWLTAYAAVVARIGDVLDAGRLRTALDRITGTVLVALGVRLATERV